MAEAGIWTETFRVRSYETDPSGQASVATICNYLQEVAGNHAYRLGVSVEQLFEQDLTWILAKLRVKLDALPRWRDDVTIDTWPSGVEGLTATRDFVVKDASGRRLGRATSAWMMIDLNRRRPVRMPERISSLELPQRERAVSSTAVKLPECDGSAGDKALTQVRYGDLDVNGHVNNVRYVEWALEALPVEMLESQDLTEIEVHFRAEAVYGDPVGVRLRALNSEQTDFAHVILQTGDRKELARLRTMWRRR